MVVIKAEKQAYYARVQELLNEYPKILLVNADNVGSNHMQRIRKNLRGEAVLLMGKNTLIRRAMRQVLADNPGLETLLPHVRGNVGFVFSKGELNHVRDLLVQNRVAAPARAGAIAPNDVVIPAGNTGMEPTQTSFLQALNIPSKINKGQVEIINDVHLITTGEKVGASEATLLAKLNIKPFTYGLSCTVAYDSGSVFESSVLDITPEDIVKVLTGGIQRIAALGLEVHFANVASVPHLLIGAFKNLVGICMETEYTFPAVEQMKNAAANPVAAAAAPVAAAAETKAAKVEEPEEEEEDEDMGFGLFD